MSKNFSALAQFPWIRDVQDANTTDSAGRICRAGRDPDVTGCPLSIDVMLPPALPDIGHDLGVVRENDRPLVLSVFFFGLAFGQIISGPISDAVGRRPVVGAGMVIFVIGCLLSMVSDDFRSLLAGRFCQGLGIAGPRIVTMAIVRDQYAGRGMAQIMSVVMAIFIIVPALAPLLGLGIMKLAGWRAIFGVLLGVGIGTIT